MLDASSILPELPVHQALPELRRVLSERRTAVLSAPPGSGKTTLVPLALRDQPWLDGQVILMLEPRRLAARAAAARMASLSGERVGEGIGYRVRMDSQVSAATRIEVLTEGMLTRRLQHDPELHGVGLVIFDEFHERNLQADLALALCLDVQQDLRENLRLMVMSATLDAGPVARLLGGAAVIRAEGRSYPVESIYLDRDPVARELLAAVITAVRAALRERDGDLLVFLPGAAEIRRVGDGLAGTLPDDVVVYHLYGDLSQQAQDLALAVDPEGRRRVVLSTDIAESSLTIDGVRVVVDAGLARRPRFDPNTGLSGLATRRISKASATQRAGRAGRLAPGVCYRLWSRASHRGLVAHDPAEVLGADLSALVLELAVWGTGDPGQLAWLDPPPSGALAQARALLTDLGALDERRRTTARGRAMAELPLHPRLAHMVLEAADQGCAQAACRLAALLSERDILPRQGDGSADIDYRMSLLDSLGSARSGGPRGFDSRAGRRVLRIAGQWQRLLERGHRQARTGGGVPGCGLSAGTMLAWAYPDRVARRRGGDGHRYLLANGRGVVLREHDPLSVSDWLVVAHLDAVHGDGRIFLAAAVDLDSLRVQLGGRITALDVVAWDSREQAVLMRHEERLGALCLSVRPCTDAEPGRIVAAMLEGIRAMGLEALPWTAEARRFQTRVIDARAWCTSGVWPDLSDERLMINVAQWLGPYLDGIRRRSHLPRLDLELILRSQLDWQAQQDLDRLLPTHWTAPSGSRIRLEYRLGEPPVLAVRLQEMFGCTETPTVCDNAIPVVVHLLSPARRPIQVTSDLRGFWKRTYLEVRKELKGRYPKHYWPDDPTTAVATSRVRPGNTNRK